MLRLMVTILLFGVLACGGSDTGETGAAGGSAPGGETASAPETPEPSVAVAPMVQRCLDLVRELKYNEARPVCTGALKVHPDNQELKDALAKAREETAKPTLEEAAKMAAAKAGSQAEGEGAAEEATSKLGEATGGMAGELGQ